MSENKELVKLTETSKQDVIPTKPQIIDLDFEILESATNEKKIVKAIQETTNEIINPEQVILERKKSEIEPTTQKSIDFSKLGYKIINKILIRFKIEPLSKEEQHDLNQAIKEVIKENSESKILEMLKISNPYGMLIEAIGGIIVSRLIDISLKPKESEIVQ